MLNSSPMWPPEDGGPPEEPPRREDPCPRLFEGGESLCEFYIQPSERTEKSRTPQTCDQDARPPAPHQVDSGLGEGPPPCRDLASLLGRELPPADTFTRTFLQSVLLSVDSTDPVVANAWMETLLDVIDLLPMEVIRGEILSLAVSKGQMSQPVPSRLLSCRLLGKICEKFDPCTIRKEVLPSVLSLCQDVDSEVRGAMCGRLDVVAGGLGSEAVKSSVLPELVELANDEENSVRLAAVEAVVRMVPLLDADTCSLIIVPLMRKCCEGALQARDSTLPVIAGQLGRLCRGLWAIFSPEQKDWFLGFFRGFAESSLSSDRGPDHPARAPMPDLLPEVDHRDRHRECRAACAYNFPAMVLFVGADGFERELHGCFGRLCADPFPDVRCTMARGFHEVCRLLGSRSSILHPELVLLLRDDSTEVLKGLVPRLAETLKAIYSHEPKDDVERREELVGALLACEERTSLTTAWRLHMDLLSRLSVLPACLSPDVVLASFVPLLFVKMHTARPIPCRTAAVYSLLVILRHTPSLESRKGIVGQLVSGLCHARSCHKRMLFVRVCELVAELFSKTFFKAHFFRPLLQLSGDPVPNVRLRLCSALPALKGLLRLPRDSALLSGLEACVKGLMAAERDADVAAAVREAIEKLDKIEVAAEVVSKRSSCLDAEDRRKEDEELLQLHEEFNFKLPKPNSVSKPLRRNNNKGGKIPVLKSPAARRDPPEPSKDDSSLVPPAGTPLPSRAPSTHTWPRQKRAPGPSRSTPDAPGSAGASPVHAGSRIPTPFTKRRAAKERADS